LACHVVNGMTNNKWLLRLIKEADDPKDTASDSADNSTEEVDSESEIPTDEEVKAAPTVEEMVNLWRAGEHLAVAARLMFSYAAYEDFVKILFILGEKDALELGRLLDMLADTENIAPPKTPGKYLELLAKVRTANKDSEVL